MKNIFSQLWRFYTTLPTITKMLFIATTGVIMFIGQMHWANLWKNIWARFASIPVSEAYPQGSINAQIGDLAPLIITAIYVIAIAKYSFPSQNTNNEGSNNQPE